MDRSEQGLHTRIVHAGQSPDPVTGALTASIHRSAPFVFESLEVLDQYSAKTLPHYEYSRTTHPTGRILEAKLAALDRAEDALILASGMAAITAVLLATLGQGDHLVVTDNGYKRSLRFMSDTLPRWGIRTDLVDSREPLEAVRAAFTPATKLVFAEVPSNPNLRVIDIAALADITHAAGALLAVDATIASPYNLRPLEHRADIVIHSATKYLGGHNDVLGGVVAASLEVLQPIRDISINLGATLDPEACYLILRGIKTLGVRVERQNETALTLARWLESRPEVSCVYYPGLESDPTHALAKRQMDGYGGMLSFDLRTDLAGISRFVNALGTILFAPSLGGVESLIIHPGITVRHDLTDAERERFGYTDTLLRLAVGLEDPKDLKADLERGLAAL
ncbi:MAG: PLP-dependent transferase [Armatimonadetes bacterium]|nr:PLP-dependent transferase [Armatimonadota bacterium]